MTGWRRVASVGLCCVTVSVAACAGSRPPDARSAEVNVPTTDSGQEETDASALVAEGDRLMPTDVVAAIESYEAARKLTPHDHALLYKLALAYEKREQWEPMIAVLARATELAPDFANYHFRYGYALYEDEQFSEARAPFEACLEADPNFAGCEYYRGEVCLQLVDDQCALERFTAAIRLDPTRGEYYSALADVYLVHKLYAEAEQVLVAATRFLPPVAKNRERLYTVYRQLYQVAQARHDADAMIAAAEQAVEHGGEAHPEMAFVLGATYAMAKPPQKGKATRLLKSFLHSACRGREAAKFKEQCETAQSLLQVMGHAVP
jgi:tetratricopeptide (TPR) repeat protein